MKFDLDLLARHDRPGPRYTSYPTAVEFQPGYGPADHARALEASRAAGRPLSVYVHLPFCRSLCWFCACSVVITSNRGRIARYLEAVERELALVLPLAGPGRPLAQLHWGGGTPSYLAPDSIRGLAARIQAAFPPAPDAELSVEVDPRELDRERLAALAGAGFNRVSMGVQDFDPQVQAAIHRLQPEELTRRAVETARELGFRSVNLDLVYGLPHQTASSFERTVDAVLALAPDRIALYSFAHLPALKKHHRVIPPAHLPAPASKLAIFKRAADALVAAGYRYLGMDHFARPEDELSRALDEGTLQRNFQGYSTRAGSDLVGLGMTAIGQTEAAYAQNHKEERDYLAAVDRGELPIQRGILLSADDRLRRDVIMGLMCRGRVSFEEVESRHGGTFEREFECELADLEAYEREGLVERRDREIRLTESGRLLVRNVALVFDRYRRGAASPARFSRTI